MGGWIEQNVGTIITVAVLAGSGLMAFATLRADHKGLERSTAERFANVDEQIGDKFATLNTLVHDMSKDMKTLIAWMNRQQGIDEGRRIGRRHDDDIQTGGRVAND